MSYRATEWRAEAACREVEPWVFFPSAGDRPLIEAAKKVCAVCPVRGECLDHALACGEEGVWGGTTDAERASMTTEAAS